MDPLNVVILAAGKGTRMHSDKPKVLHQLAGKALVQHVLDCAHRLDPQRICVIYGHGGDAVPNALQRTDAQCVLQSPQLGTGHAVQQAVPHLAEHGRTMILYGDVPLIGRATLHRMLQNSDGMTLLTVNLDNPTGYGRILRDGNGDVTGIVEEKDATPEQREIREVNTGIMLVPNGLLRDCLASLRNDNSQGEYYLTDVVGLAAQAGTVIHTAQPDCEWEIHGINSKSQLATLERTWQSVEAQRLLDKGVTLADPARIDQRGSLECGRDVEIDVGCIFEGHVTLGDNVRIGPYCVIRDATIANGAQIAAYTHIDAASVGPGCQIGPYARLRPGATLHEQVHIGNFVEVKNSEIGNGSKANHLSYIGDTSIGDRVNVGAGTITCNYDGANKHRTVIEDDVFIGSDTQLVAPVTVCKGSTIGAGSTITKNTPQGELTLSRSKQVTISGWVRPKKQVKMDT